tara:strand:- start:1259 stop:1510 length:252 start_codon:yes stop_codon:yes gene_type:complete
MNELITMKRLLIAIENLTDEVRISREGHEKSIKFQKEFLEILRPQLALSHVVQLEEEASEKRKKEIRNLLLKEPANVRERTEV